MVAKGIATIPPIAGNNIILIPIDNVITEPITFTTESALPQEFLARVYLCINSSKVLFLICHVI